MKENPFSPEEIEYLNLKYELMTEKEKKKYIADYLHGDSDDVGSGIMGVVLGGFLIFAAICVATLYPAWFFSCLSVCLLTIFCIKKLKKSVPVRVEMLQELRQRVLTKRFVEGKIDEVTLEKEIERNVNENV